MQIAPGATSALCQYWNAAYENTISAQVGIFSKNLPYAAFDSAFKAMLEKSGQPMDISGGKTFEKVTADGVSIQFYKKGTIGYVAVVNVSGSGAAEKLAKIVMDKI